MRDAFAATVVAAALVFVPAQARLEPMASTIAQFDSDVIEVSATAEVQTNNPADTVLETSEPEPGDPLLGAKDRDEGNETNGTAASVSPESGAPAGASADAICATLGRSAAQNSLPLDFFIRLIWQESRFNPFSVSHAGAQGIAQFMPGTARGVGLLNPFDPIQALVKSAALLRDLRTQFGNLGLAAAAYNAGPKRVEDWLSKRKVLPQETEAYVRIVTGRSAQEWTSADANSWNVALPAPAPCEQLAKPAPRRVLPVLASRPRNREADRPLRPILVAEKVERSAAITRRETIRCCRLPAKSEKVAQRESGAASRETVRCCRSPANGVKLVRLDASVATPKSAPSRARGASRGSDAEASHSPRRETPAASHRRPAPSARTARVA